MLFRSDLLGGAVGKIENHTDTEHTVWYFGEERSVNSFHTMYIECPHKTATTLVVDSQGNTEAWIDNNIAGVVWHPERMSTPWIPDEIEDLLKVKL